MKENGNKFDYSYSAPTEDERREIEDIKRQYVAPPQKEDKLEKLRKLNGRVTKPPLIMCLIMGIFGILVFGLGMTMVLEWNLLAWGIVVGVTGAAVAGVSYPVYKALLKRNKAKYGQRIIELSNELLNEKDN